MRYSPLGRSGLMVSAVCLGGNSWGAAGRRAWAPLGREESRPFIKRALDLGINFFDTANAYNEGESESILGETLLRYAKREDVVVCTKVGLPPKGAPNRHGLGRKHILASVDESLKRLGTDYIDLYLAHYPDPVTPLDETLDAFTDCVRAGKVRYIGASNYAAWKFAQMLMLADWKGYARPIAMQSQYNLIEREQELEMNPLCREQGVALTPFSPNARGFLAGNRQPGGGATERAQKDALAHKADRRDCDFEIVEVARMVAAEHGCTPAQVAMAWLWARGVTAPVIGVTRPEQIEDAVGAVRVELTPEQVARLEAPYRWRAPA